MHLLKLCPISQCPNNCVPCGRPRMKGWAKWRRTPIVLLLRNCLPSLFAFQWILCVHTLVQGSPLRFRGTVPVPSVGRTEHGDGQRPGECGDGEKEKRGCNKLCPERFSGKTQCLLVNQSSAPLLLGLKLWFDFFRSRTTIQHLAFENLPKQLWH